VDAQYRISGRTAHEITASVEDGVRLGAIPPDSHLPSVRGLASDLGVSPATVASAYQRLRQRGVVCTDGRRGTRVRTTPPIAAVRSFSNVLVPSGIRDLADGEPDPLLLPDIAPVLRSLSTEDLRLGDLGPLPELLDYAKQQLIELPSDAVYTMVAGALDGIDRLLTSHLRPGDRIGVEDPGWSAALDVVAVHGLVPVPMPVDDEGPTPDGVRAAVEAGARAIVVTARAHNPTGASISGSRANALRPLISDVLLIEDDHAAGLTHLRLHPLSGSGSRWAFLRSASKPFGPDLRCAVLAGDAETIARVEGRLRLNSGWVSTILQRVFLQMWRHHDLTAARRLYDTRRSALLLALARRGIHAQGRTGINVWIPVADEVWAVASLREAGYAVAPGRLYRVRSEPGVRVTISALPEPEAEAFADAVAAARAVPRRMAIAR